MNDKEINHLVVEWEKMTSGILHLQEPNLNEMQNIFNKTYKILFDLKSENLIPKDLAKMLINIEDFFYFLSLTGENEHLKIFDYYQNLFYISKTLKDDFFNNSFESDYPELSVRYCGDKVKFNFEKDNLEDFLNKLQK